MDSSYISVVHDSDPIRAWYSDSEMPGDNSLVVVFNSIGELHEEYPKPEFVRSARLIGKHVLFLSDISRSWLNGSGVKNTFTKIITTCCEEHAPTKIHFLGTSMGAFNALCMTQEVDVDTILAFNPQFSPLWRHVPEENRWRRYRKAIKNPIHSAINISAIRARRCVILHGSSPDETIHSSRFPVSADIEHLIMDGLGHNIASYLRKQGQLEDFLVAVFSADHDRDIRSELASFLPHDILISAK